MSGGLKMSNAPANRGEGRPKIFLYGPPGCGKSTLGRLLAKELYLPFWDLDDEIQHRSQNAIPEIFQKEGEAGFRDWERRILEELITPDEAVIALGGGALIDSETRARVESAGQVLFLEADPDTLLQRLLESNTERPLLQGNPDERLEQLLNRRASHYASFANRISVEPTLQDAAWQAQISLGYFRVTGMGEPYNVRVLAGGLAGLGGMLRQHGLGPKLAVVSDENVAALFGSQVEQALHNAGYSTTLLKIPAGERYKTPETISDLWRGMVAAGLERGSCVAAVGGGVVGDLAGFAAATYLRGISWVVVPTSLLAMVDASLGGKTGADLPEGKNLVGAFHSPRLVFADPNALHTLPPEELRSGMAEVVKHAVISDPRLFDLCAHPEQFGTTISWEELVRRAMAVKIRIILTDPYEKGARAALNFGHTVGHAVEAASNYRLRHGEAVSIGMVVAARLAERIGLAQRGLSKRITTVLAGLGLPTQIPNDIAVSDIIDRLRVDKKRAQGKLRFALPTRIGEVLVGIEVDAKDIPWEE